MKKIEHVRKNIADRKKKKITSSVKIPNQAKVFVPQDEEMHGYPPFVETNKGKHPISKKSYSLLGVQAVASLLLFAGVFISERASIAFAEEPRAWVSSQLQDEFPFAKVTAWYGDRFGDPLQLVEPKDEIETNQVAFPVNGVVTEPFENHGRGIIMSAEEGEKVKSVKEGTVIFAGNDPETKKTIIIQHKDDTNTIYGFLSTIDVHLYEHIPAQQTIATLNESGQEKNGFFFAIKKDQEYLDPIEVIKVDEGS
ncbi:peptidoglycan DD-metalloendopeptidase family protein [Halobacillus seohaensis]|uniref:Peptidoglycan DD-metalloendopeptidase family protein n=1 Tax=Halobacillus seohaensis TaxID=447421 RepID=A0ABW2EGY8_9BACI